MPFTPIHMGSGILIKLMLQGSFSLMVFGWTQIVMDIQPKVIYMVFPIHILVPFLLLFFPRCRVNTYQNLA